MHIKFSHEIESLLQRLTHQSLSIGEILEETASRGFSLSLGLLVLPFLFPMPPGLSSILGFGCLLLSLQMAMGRTSPWLPQKIAKFQFPRSFILYLLKNLKKVTHWLEKIIRPRWFRIAKSPYTWRTNGFCIAWLAFLLMLPIPFTNSFPAVTMLLLAVATLEADGLVMCFSYGLMLAVTSFFAFLGYAAWQAPELLPSIFQ
jgi:hypothetical protein